jgi:threonine synthase
MIRNLCDCGSPLAVRYRLENLGPEWQHQLAARPKSLWRYREVLPVERDDSIVTLGEGFTPLIRAGNLAGRLNIPNLFLKDESFNPTGSFKARGMAVAVSMARELGIRKLAVPSAGNAGGALAAYAARAGIQAMAFMPEATPLANRQECALMGAEVVLVPGSITDCGRAMRQRIAGTDWFDCSTLREPYRVEGKKTMAYEIFEQLGGRLPEVILYPTGGGTGLVGMWKAFDEMQAMGWIGHRRPRMFAVQAAGCAPILRAFAGQKEAAEEWQHPQTLAAGLRVPAALGDFWMLRVLRDSRGGGIAIDDGAMLEGVRELARTEGIVTSPEGGACIAALGRLLHDGYLAGFESIVVFLTATGYKYGEVMAALSEN